MIDRIFMLTLTFALLAGGTLAIGGEFFLSRDGAKASHAIVELPRVVITGSVERRQTDVARADAVVETRNGDKVQ